MESASNHLLSMHTTLATAWREYSCWDNKRSVKCFDSISEDQINRCCFLTFVALEWLPLSQ